MIYFTNRFVRDPSLTHITINRGNFTSLWLTMSLSGLVTLNHCSSSRDSYLTITNCRSEYEPAPTEENVRSFHSYVKNKPDIKLYNSQFGQVVLTFCDIARKVSIIDCEFYSFVITAWPVHDDLTLVLVQIFGSYSKSTVNSWRVGGNFFLFFILVNINISNVKVWTSDLNDFNGKLGLHLENVTWVNNNEGFLFLRNVISVIIVSS